MPDVHLASGVCIGTVTATSHRIFPAAVGGDIGCGVAGLRFEGRASALYSREAAAKVLAGLYERVPFIKHSGGEAPALPEALSEQPLHSPSLASLAQRDGRRQLGTLGRGNHFLELQRDEEDGLWLMVHSGSRAMGPAIREHHQRFARADDGLPWLDAEADDGLHYLADAEWARAYARASRKLMAERVAELLDEAFGIGADWSSLSDCDHNHVVRETIAGARLWVHRKGALRANDGESGVIPGSMGSASYHVRGRGHAEALCSSSHGAGREMSRTEARQRITKKALLREAKGVFFDHRLTERLREEAPGAYKDIEAVMKAQHELTRVVRRLEPLLVYKGA
jgi:tRNA-splicing ligase RtcB